jgi:hypothetical protein
MRPDPFTPFLLVCKTRVLFSAHLDGTEVWNLELL